MNPAWGGALEVVVAIPTDPQLFPSDKMIPLLPALPFGCPEQLPGINALWENQMLSVDI